MNNKKHSYTSADNLPFKLLQDGDLISEIVSTGYIRPQHVQIIPTNKCNLKCKFCSCMNEDRTEEFPLSSIEEVIEMLSEAGTEAVTITGGGEPLLYPYLDSMVEEFNEQLISVGLVTNGLLLKDKDYDWMWCRVSCSDERSFKVLEKKMLPAVVRNPQIDWALSYVVTSECDYENIAYAVEFANEYNFTHVRLVSDLLDLDNVPVMDKVRDFLEARMDISKVLFQGRKKPERGGDCYICYLKPVVTPSLKVYACCGAQFALNPPSLKFPDELCLGTLSEFLSSDQQSPLDGSICHKCYYGNYNRIIEKLLTPLEHRKFV